MTSMTSALRRQPGLRRSPRTAGAGTPRPAAPAARSSATPASRRPRRRQRRTSATTSRPTASDSASISPARRARGQERDRRQQALPRVLPAHQRLEAAHLLGRRVDLRLVPDRAAGRRRWPGAGPRPAAAAAGRSRRCARRRAARRPGCPWPGTSRRRPGAAGRCSSLSAGARTVIPIEALIASSRPSMQRRLQQHVADQLGGLQQLDRVVVCAPRGRTRRRRAGPISTSSAAAPRRIRCATSSSTASPAAWPRVSLISLKPSRSSSIRASGVGRAQALVEPCRARRGGSAAWSGRRCGTARTPRRPRGLAQRQHQPAARGDAG